MIIQKNFLKLDDYNKLKEVMFSKHFPWFYSNAAVNCDKSYFQFTHNFISYQNVSPTLKIVQPLLDKIKPPYVERIKANLTTQTSKIIETGTHEDNKKDYYKSSIFFLNDCDGYCRIGDTKIKSEDNKLLTFNSSQLHAGSTCTDASRRIVINLVYSDKR